MSATVVGLEECLVQCIGQMFDTRVDYRGRQSYSTNFRYRIGTNHMGRLSFGLKLAGYRHTLEENRPDLNSVC